MRKPAEATQAPPEPVPRSIGSSNEPGTLPANAQCESGRTSHTDEEPGSRPNRPTRWATEARFAKAAGKRPRRALRQNVRELPGGEAHVVSRQRRLACSPLCPWELGGRAATHKRPTWVLRYVEFACGTPLGPKGPAPLPNHPQHTGPCNARNQPDLNAQARASRSTSPRRPLLPDLSSHPHPLDLTSQGDAQPLRRRFLKHGLQPLPRPHTPGCEARVHGSTESTAPPCLGMGWRTTKATPSKAKG